MKEKSAVFCFLELKAKEKANFSKIIGGRMTFLWKISGLVFQSKCLLTELDAEGVAIE